jgi:hypothetical protein
MTFEVNKTGSETILDVFAGGATGFDPFAPVRDPQVNLYGMTAGSGDDICNPPYGCGIVFMLSPPATTTATELTCSPNPSTHEEAVTFTAVVAPAPPNGETVSFTRGKTVLGKGTLCGGTLPLQPGC